MSDSIYQNKPYTYLIKFIPTGQVYYGVRWANQVAPEDDLWKKYFTSSKYVKELIDEYGSEWFEYEVRQVFESVDKARDWEERVLKRMDVVKSDNWLNKSNMKTHFSNESGFCNPKTLTKAFDAIKQKYNVDNISQIQEIKDKKRVTFIRCYGGDNPMRCDSIKEKIQTTNLIKYGCESPLGNKDVIKKSKETLMKNYGVEIPLKNSEIMKKAENTNIERYGYKRPAQNKEILAKMAKTTEERYGVKNYFQTEESRKMSRKKYKCSDCDFISNKGNVTKHHTRLNHSGFEEV